MTTWTHAIVAGSCFAAGVATETLRAARAVRTERAAIEAALAAGATPTEAIKGAKVRRFAASPWGGVALAWRLFEVFVLGSPVVPFWDVAYICGVLNPLWWNPATRSLGRALAVRRLFSDGLPPEEPDAGAAHAFRIVGPIKTYDENVRPKTFADRDLKD